MRRFRRAGVTVTLMIGLLAGSSAASAQVDERAPTDSEELADTLFTFGYDLMTRLFLWNISSLEDGGPECAVDLIGSDCPMTEGDVTGPNDQVNHGMFMKLFNSLYEGAGRGCVVRHLAQSDLGKGEQSVKAGEETTEPTEPTVVDFTSISTNCESGKERGDDDSADDGQRGKPDHTGKPDHPGKPESPGNSGSAPGQNKESKHP